MFWGMLSTRKPCSGGIAAGFSRPEPSEFGCWLITQKEASADTSEITSLCKEA